MNGFSTELTHRFAAPPAEVYRAFTDAELLSEWFGPGAFRVPRESVDLDIRPGGHWRLTMVNADNPEMRIPIDATVIEAVPAQRFVIERIAQGYHDMPDGTRLSLSVTFTDDGDGTVAQLVDGPFSEFMRDTNSAGWLQELARLDEVLETLPPARGPLRLVD